MDSISTNHYTDHNYYLASETRETRESISDFYISNAYINYLDSGMTALYPEEDGHASYHVIYVCARPIETVH